MSAYTQIAEYGLLTAHEGQKHCNTWGNQHEGGIWELVKENLKAYGTVPQN